MSIDAMKQALEALQNTARVFEDPSDLLVADVDLVLEAITALRLAIEQAEKYDQTALELCDKCGWKTLIPGDCCLHCVRQEPVPKSHGVKFDSALHEHLSALPQQEKQEPVAWRWIPSKVFDDFVVSDDREKAASARKHGMNVQPLYTAPPQRQPLTDVQIDEIWRTHLHRDSRVRAIERKHGIGGEHD